MKSRLGLVLALALGFGLSACASGAGPGASTSGLTASTPVAGGEVLAQGERPRQDDNTRAA